MTPIFSDSSAVSKSSGNSERLPLRPLRTYLRVTKILRGNAFKVMLIDEEAVQALEMIDRRVEIKNIAEHVNFEEAVE